jgi:hypothetical protein
MHGVMRIANRCLVWKLNRKGRFRGLSIGGKIILKRILK